MSQKNNSRFSFTWKIANFQNCYQQNGSEISSPSFVAECLGGSRWYLELYPKGLDGDSVDFISCFLIREGDCSYNGNIIVDYTLQIIGGNGEILETFNAKNKEFDQGDSNGCDRLAEFNKILNRLKEQNEDTLTIQSIIEGREMKMATAAVVQSEINTDRYNFKWNVDYYANDSNLPEQEKLFHLGELQFKITLYTANPSITNDLIINISLMECTYAVPCLVNCQISFLNQKGIPDLTFRGTHIFRSKSEIWTLPPFITIQELNNSESIYMTDEMFVMLFDFSGSNDMVTETIPTYTYDTSYNADSLSVLQSDFRELFVSKKHTDVIFRINHQELPVHKAVLIARSPVFSTMFDQNMTENQTGVVDIIDVDLETLKSFLEYLYTGTIEKLDYDNAIKLFTVAEKYQVQSLIDECYAFFLPVLSIKNVCELIYVADMANHKHLKMAGMNYIAIHTKDILITPEWNKWAEKNLKLTSEIFSYIASNCEITLKKSESDE